MARTKREADQLLSNSKTKKQKQQEAIKTDDNNDENTKQVINHIPVQNKGQITSIEHPSEIIKTALKDNEVFLEALNF